eukprot:scpid56843/ scgid27863/ Leucine-rich repeats and immunoglobulin-like domains protein 3
MACGTGNDRKDTHLYVLLFSYLLIYLTEAHEDQEGQCPKQCSCATWHGDLFIDCSDKQLTSIPQLPHNVKYLHLNGNRLTQITMAEGLTQYPLIELYLQDNQISRISKNGLPPTLESLSVENNRLTGVNKKMFRQKSNLLVLNLNGNRIKRIGKEAFPPSLEHLQIKDNRLTRIHTGMFSHLHSLRSLYLNKNWIKQVKENSFPSEISVINLGNNRLSNVGNQFAGLPKLRVLNLYSNRIRMLSPRAFTNMPSLKELSLLDNRLREIAALQFATLASLTTLNLFSNMIQKVHFTALPPRGKLQRLYLQKNPLLCDCHLEWLAIKLRQEQLNAKLFDLFFLDSSVPEKDWPFDYPDEDDIRCAAPAANRGRKVMEQRTDFTCDGSFSTTAIRETVRITTTAAIAAVDILQLPVKEMTELLTSSTLVTTAQAVAELPQHVDSSTAGLPRTTPSPSTDQTTPTPTMDQTTHHVLPATQTQVLRSATTTTLPRWLIHFKARRVVTSPLPTPSSAPSAAMPDHSLLLTTMLSMLSSLLYVTN